MAGKTAATYESDLFKESADTAARGWQHFRSEGHRRTQSERNGDLAVGDINKATRVSGPCRVFQAAPGGTFQFVKVFGLVVFLRIAPATRWRHYQLALVQETHACPQTHSADRSVRPVV
jgi:hypothetical protein